MNIAFFISNHGFGHIMRELPVAAELIERGHDVTIVTGDHQAEVTDMYLNGKERLIVCDTDAGMIVRPGTLIIDREATIARVREHVKKWPELIANAPDADIYAADIVPWALTAAKEKGIPSFFISNFTWIEQYEQYLPEELLSKYIDAFADADKVLLLALANDPTKKFFDGDKASRVCGNVGFIARPFHMEEVEKIRRGHSRPIVFLSLGASNSGLDFDIDVSGLPYDFISTQALRLIGDNVEYLEATVPNSQDYVKASDFCIAKAGWSTVSEAMLAGVPFAVLERDDTPEDVMTVRMLREKGDALSLKTEELRNLGTVLQRMETYSWPQKNYTNNYAKAAEMMT